MDEIEIQIFDEINDYKEKIGIMTFRQWLFAALIVALVVPTYIILPRVTFITEDIASYIVILEAGIVGFIGFVKIHNLPAEKIMPFWYRHYFVFGKPIKFMTIKEYQKLLEEKKNKNKKQSSKIVPIENSDGELTPKQIKAKEKQEKELKKAKKKYGYLFKDKSPVSEPNNDISQSDNLSETVVNSDKTTSENKTVTEDKSKKDYQKTEEVTASSTADEEIKNTENTAIKNDISVSEDTSNTEIEDKEEKIIESSSEEEDVLNDKLKSLSDDEKKVLLKLLGK